MTRGSLFCLVGFLLCLEFCGPSRPAHASAPMSGAGSDPAIARRLGAQTLAILAGAARVETFRVGVTPAFDQPASTVRVDDRLLSATGASQDKAFAAKMAAILRDPRLYDVPHDRCLFQPGIVFRLWSGRSSVDCLLCFHCDDILILTRDSTGHVVHTEFTNFAPLRPTLLALVKQTFPTDQEIQSLPAN